MPELVLSPSLDLTPWRGESTSTSLYESPMSPTKVTMKRSPPSAGTSAADVPELMSLGASVAAPVVTRRPSVGLVAGIDLSRLQRMQASWRASK